jgi:hypothetical protein
VSVTNSEQLSLINDLRLWASHAGFDSLLPQITAPDAAPRLFGFRNKKGLQIFFNSKSNTSAPPFGMIPSPFEGTLNAPCWKKPSHPA